MHKLKTSIIICTRNRAESLTQTLSALRDVCVPAEIDPELIVVDNGSTDHTQTVIKQALLPHMPVRGLVEPERGQARARNAGMANAHGDIIVFTDDDVRPCRNWLQSLCHPLRDGQADAVVGRVVLPGHLYRPWMSVVHLGWLACTDWMKAANTVELVGANMAFARHVLARVPGFDPELGPGALGFADDSLFSWQLAAAGFRIGYEPDAVVEHHFDAGRLGRAGFARDAVARGRTRAYVMHHWLHERIEYPLLRLTKIRARAMPWAMARHDIAEEGMASQEMHLLETLALYRGFLTVRHSRRKYARHGLVKLDHAQQDQII